MKTHHLHREILLERPLEEVFPFFADPANLEEITPSWLKFQVTDSSTPGIQEGTELDYRLRLHGLPLRWRSRISVWDPPYRFVDEQVRGPYAMWRHLHTFEPARGGKATIARDWVEYRAYGGPLVHGLFIARDLRSIFDHRLRTMGELFGATEGSATPLCPA